MDTHKETQYQQDLIEALQDPVESAAYLESAKEEDKELVLLALSNLIKANQSYAFRQINTVYNSQVVLLIPC